MTTVLIIRFHYQKDDPRFAWRFAYFQSMVLPRILGQTDQNFDIAIWCNEWHDGLFRALSEKIRTFRVKAEARYRTGIGGKRYFLDFAPWKDVEGLEQYDIQAGLDSDDLVEPDFISTIHELVKKNGAENSLHISFQPGLFFVKKLATGPMRNIYGPTRGSAFMALYQPDKKDYKFIYERSHLTLGRFASRSVCVSQVKVWATVHDINESTTG